MTLPSMTYDSQGYLFEYLSHLSDSSSGDVILKDPGRRHLLGSRWFDMELWPRSLTDKQGVCNRFSFRGFTAAAATYRKSQTRRLDLQQECPS